MRWFQATDSFSATLADGSELSVVKGQPMPESHELVRLDQDQGTSGRQPLFKLMDAGEPEAPKAAPRARKGGM